MSAMDQQRICAGDGRIGRGNGRAWRCSACLSCSTCRHCACAGAGTAGRNICSAAAQQQGNGHAHGHPDGAANPCPVCRTWNSSIGCAARTHARTPIDTADHGMPEVCDWNADCARCDSCGHSPSRHSQAKSQGAMRLPGADAIGTADQHAVQIAPEGCGARFRRPRIGRLPGPVVPRSVSCQQEPP